MLADNTLLRIYIISLFVDLDDDDYSATAPT